MKRHITPGGVSVPSGNVSLAVIRGKYAPATPAHEMKLDELLYYAFPRKGLGDLAFAFRMRNAIHVTRGLRRVVMARVAHIAHFYGRLSLAQLNGLTGEYTELGIASLRVVTDTGVAFIVDAFQNIVELEIMKFHALGTGTNAEAAGDTALQTELTTEYTGNVRATGTTTEGATGNIYRTVATNTLDSGTPAVTEHGVLSQAATGGGVLLDRSAFAAINLVGANGDGIASTYDLTLSSGG